MTEKSSPLSQKARDEALRALVVRGGLTPDQVSALKLNQVHLATGTLVVEPDEFALAPSSTEQFLKLKLDGETQRAIIAWLVVRPDSSNDHLFPGTGRGGLDVVAVRQVIAGDKAAKPPPVTVATGPTTPSGIEREKPVGLPEPIVRRPPPRPSEQHPQPSRTHRVEDEAPSPPSLPPVPREPSAHKEQPEAVSLDEIEALRRHLAEVYDDWSPAVSAPPAKPSSMAAPSPLIEPKHPRQVAEPEAPSEPVVESVAEVKAPPSSPVEVEHPAAIARPAPTPASERRIPPPVTHPASPLSDRMRGALKPGENKITLHLSYRAMAVGGMALAIVCCLGLVVIGGITFRAGGPAALLAGVAPAKTPTEAGSLVAPVLSPSPSPTATATPEPSPTVVPTPTDTPSLLPTTGPTPTPIIIVVTATPAPEPSPTSTPAPTDTPISSTQPTPTVTPPPAFKYQAPVLLEPQDGGVVPGRLALLKWEPVGPLADDEWYAVRLVYLQQGKPVYQGDPVKVPEWLVPERFYYQADGPALEYSWFVFVERRNPDGSMTQLSPESKTFTFRWQ